MTSDDGMRQLDPGAAVAGTPSPVRVIGPVTRTDFVRYAGAGGDFNPLHHDDERARAEGYPSVFSMGLFQAGLASLLAADWLRPSNMSLFGVRFLEPVWPDEVLVVTGEVTNVHVGDGLARIEIQIVVTNTDGDEKVEAWASGAIPLAASLKARNGPQEKAR